MKIKEIEVKARVQDLDSFITKAKKLGIVFGPTLHQFDRVFLPKGITFKSVVPGTNALRIREENDRVFFTLKQRQNVELSAVEAEIEVTDAQALPHLIELLGFYEAVTIDKKRRKAEYGEYEICLDEVKGLGSFVEVQKFSEGDGEIIQNELFEFLKKFGIDERSREKKGYDTLMNEVVHE